MVGGAPLPPCFAIATLRVAFLSARMVPLPRFTGEEKQSRSRGAFFASEFMSSKKLRSEAVEIRFQYETTLFDSLPATKGKRSAERRIVLPMSASSAAARCDGSTPPFGAHARGTRHRLLPRWLSPRTGFPAARRETGVSPASPAKGTAVKHAPCGPVFVPVDRGPRAARERIGKKSARGHRIPLRCYGLPSGTAPSPSGIMRSNRNGDAMSRKT
jgi:hypothetical protein